MMKEAGEAVEGLSLRISAGKVYYENDLVRFEGFFHEEKDLMEETITSITLFGQYNPYCLYGIRVGDPWGRSMGMDTAGSGEQEDMYGNILYTGGAYNEENPCIKLYIDPFKDRYSNND